MTDRQRDSAGEESTDPCPPRFPRMPAGLRRRAWQAWGEGRASRQGPAPTGGGDSVGGGPEWNLLPASAHPSLLKKKQGFFSDGPMVEDWKGLGECPS